uniref:Protein Ric1 n=1 Tax=Ascaris lumbricoides TaxID=6252 RepID=A0A0M3IB92_ASCLU
MEAGETLQVCLVGICAANPECRCAQHFKSGLFIAILVFNSHLCDGLSEQNYCEVSGNIPNMSQSPSFYPNASFLFITRVEPVGVFVEKGCSIHLLINILLTLLGYIPGLIHACFIIVKY